MDKRNSESMTSKKPKQKKKLPPGIRIHGRKIRIDFMYQNKRYREPLIGLKVTDANIKMAARKRDAILYAIETQTFDYAKEFPNSRHAKLFPSITPKSVGEALDDWLKLKQKKCAVSTVRGYEKDIRRYLKPRWGHYYFPQLKKTELEYWIEIDLGHLAIKTINNLLAPFRFVVKDAFLDGVIGKDPFARIPYLEKEETTEADPFSGEELYRLLNTPTHRIQELNYIEFACFSGVSVSEGFALAWEDVDWVNRTITINRACVLGEYKRPKNDKRRRTLKLFDQAYEALKRQKALTFMLPPAEVEIPEKRNKRVTTEKLRFIFLNTLTGKPHTDSKETNVLWATHLRKAGVRHRGINQCRHTFASRLLTTGRYPEKWIANYLGHTSTAMLHKHYGKFIEADAPDLEKQASEDLNLLPPKPSTQEDIATERDEESQNLVPNLSQKQKNVKNPIKINRLHGGEGGIRTLEAFRLTHFPGVLLRPLGHLTRGYTNRPPLYTSDCANATARHPANGRRNRRR